MPLQARELDLVARLRRQVEQAVQATAGAPWPDRAKTAARHLDAIHAAWWDRHEEAPDAFGRDMARLNQLARWTRDYAQNATVVRDGSRFLTPPKFFGGDPRALSECFVLSVSLNHALPDTAEYLDELRDFQARDSCLRAHRDYFAQPYAYRKFFLPRAKLLASYARTLGEEADGDWRDVNAKYALYLERYPTMSARCVQARVEHAVLEREVFVIALNALAHRVVFDLLRPRAVLLAGKATWSLLEESAPVDVSESVRPRCPVTLDRIADGEQAEGSAVLRCNFLRTVLGPNSDAELEAVGRLLAEGIEADPGPLPWYANPEFEEPPGAKLLPMPLLQLEYEDPTPSKNAQDDSKWAGPGPGEERMPHERPHDMRQERSADGWQEMRKQSDSERGQDLKGFFGSEPRPKHREGGDLEMAGAAGDDNIPDWLKALVSKPAGTGSDAGKAKGPSGECPPAARDGTGGVGAGVILSGPFPDQSRGCRKPTAPARRARGTLDDQLEEAFHQVWAGRPEVVLSGEELIAAVSPLLARPYAENSIRVRISQLAQANRSAIYRPRGVQGYRYHSGGLEEEPRGAAQLAEGADEAATADEVQELDLECPDCCGVGQVVLGQLCPRCGGTGSG